MGHQVSNQPKREVATHAGKRVWPSVQGARPFGRLGEDKSEGRGMEGEFRKN